MPSRFVIGVGLCYSAPCLLPRVTELFPDRHMQTPSNVSSLSFSPFAPPPQSGGVSLRGRMILYFISLLSKGICFQSSVGTNNPVSEQFLQCECVSAGDIVRSGAAGLGTHRSEGYCHTLSENSSNLRSPGSVRRCWLLVTAPARLLRILFGVCCPKSEQRTLAAALHISLWESVRNVGFSFPEKHLFVSFAHLFIVKHFYLKKF